MTPIETVLVVGAGTMGHGISQVAAMAGYTVRLHDADPARVTAAIERIRANLEKGVQRGKVEAASVGPTLERLRPAAELAEAARGADLVVEAVPERLELKRGLFTTLDLAVAPATILATNTSSLSVQRIATATERPGRVLGLHFFNPVHIMRLVEVVRADDTEPDVVERGVAFVRSLGKEPIVVADSPGFASSRLGVVLGLEAIRMVEQEVATVPDIDRAMELGYNHPMGPLRLSDLVGLDVRLGIAEYLHETLGGDQYRPPDLLRELVAAGRLGQKTGRGFYEWDGA